MYSLCWYDRRLGMHAAKVKGVDGIVRDLWMLVSSFLPSHLSFMTLFAHPRNVPPDPPSPPVPTAPLPNAQKANAAKPSTSSASPPEPAASSSVSFVITTATPPYMAQNHWQRSGTETLKATLTNGKKYTGEICANDQITIYDDAVVISR
ncbi:hypothetical protein M422DRAFT_267395 [Sphaerobolus stellatus SS14]|uniref:Uncharacterized protein n=1 Tax=Sphaerobolus stellatus (strain SS14) TaxID=990650 RepID=A0A0C9V0Q9_SPHS4|nr:hypothetical protein M422DRAFT_267395 [Sphaerobolus stellatus SS14]